jgi:hypothetical protein
VCNIILLHRSFAFKLAGLILYVPLDYNDGGACYAHLYCQHHSSYRQHDLDFTKMAKIEPVLTDNRMAVKYCYGSAAKIHSRKTH